MQTNSFNKDLSEIRRSPIKFLADFFQKVEEVFCLTFFQKSEEGDEKLAKQKGLGTGLGALFGDAAEGGDLGGGTRDFEYLKISRVEPRPEQPRKVFEDEKIDELTESIREHGVLSPVTVRRGEDGLYQIIAGERRWRAARAAGLQEIPARIVEADDRKALELGLIENLQREDLSPIEEARGYKSLMDDFELTQDEVAQRMGKSRPAVANVLRLLTLPKELLDLVGTAGLPAGSARALLSLKDPNVMMEAARRAMEEGLSVREVEALVRRLNDDKKKERAKPPKESVDYIKDAQSRLTTTLGRRVTISQGSKDKGRIEIEYYDEDDFNVLFEVLSIAGGVSYEYNK